MLRVSTRAEVESIIQPGWRILDAGSGDNPLIHATVLLDIGPSTVVHEGKAYRAPDKLLMFGHHNPPVDRLIARIGEPEVNSSLCC